MKIYVNRVVFKYKQHQASVSILRYHPIITIYLSICE